MHKRFRSVLLFTLIACVPLALLAIITRQSEQPAKLWITLLAGFLAGFFLRQMLIWRNEAIAEQDAYFGECLADAMRADLQTVPQPRPPGIRERIETLEATVVIMMLKMEKITNGQQ